MKYVLMGLAAALALLAPSAAAALDSSPTSLAGAARVVEIRVQGDEAALSRVKLTAEELFSRLAVVPVVTSADEPGPGRTRAPWVLAHLDFSLPSSPSADIQDGQTHEELLRRTLSDSPSLEAGVESLLHVLYLAVESKLQMETLAPAPRREKPRASAPEPGAGLRLGVDVAPFLRLSSLDRRRIVPGAGLGLEPHADFARTRVGVSATAALHAESELRWGNGTADVQSLQARLMPMIDWLLSRDLSARAGVGGGLDWLRVSPGQAPDGGLARPPQSALEPIVSATLGARVRISGRASLSALGSLDVDLSPTTFVARRGPESQKMLELSRVRGGFSLALDVTLSGQPRFGAAEVANRASSRP